MRKRIILSLFVLFLAPTLIRAVPAREGLRRVSQPDGSVFLCRVLGDEFSHLTLTSDGCAVVQDNDGYFSYAFFDSEGGRHSSHVHVGTAGQAKQSSRSIPYELLKGQASERRAEAARIRAEKLQKTNNIGTRSEVQKKKVIVLLAQFPDLSFRYTQEDFVELLTRKGYSKGNATGSVLDYFNDQFQGSLDFEFDVAPIVTLPKPFSYYGHNDEKGLDEHPAELTYDACVLADEFVDFSQYAEDGEVANLYVFFAGLGEEFVSYSVEDQIWSHQWNLSSAGLQLQLDGVKLDMYAVSGELSITETGSIAISTIGVFCHEFSHLLGVWDMYDTDYEKSGGLSDALWGSLSLMDHGSYNNNGNTPPNYSAVEYDQLLEYYDLTNLEVERLSVGQQVLQPLNVRKRYLKADGDDDEEYFLFECRSQEGWDRYVGGNGLIIYHIDRTDRLAGYSANQEKNLTARQRWYFNEVNANPDNQCADLVECEVPVGESIAPIFFPHSNNDSFTPETSPAFKYRSGYASPLSLVDIKTVSKESHFTVTGPLSIDNMNIYQDAVICGWSSSSSGNTPDLNVVLSRNGEIVAEKEMKCFDGNKYACVMDGLSPKTSYSLTVYDNSNGESTAMFQTDFTTKALYSSGLPFIYLNDAVRNPDNTFKKGTRVPLRLYNAPDVLSVKWYYRGAEISPSRDGFFYLNSDGELRAVASYKDGSIEIYLKKIVLK